MDEKILCEIESMTPIQARSLIIWCAERQVPSDASSAALDAVVSASRYVNGRISYNQMRAAHDAAVVFYTKTHTRERPWRGLMTPGDATNVAMLAKLCTVDDKYINFAAKDAVSILYALEPFEEVLAMIYEQIREIKNDRLQGT